MNRLRLTILGSLIALTATQSAAASDFASEVMNATFKLFHPDSTSTCFLVHRPQPDTHTYLVTAAHSLERTKGETAILVLRAPQPDGSFKRHDHTISVRKNGTPLWVRHEELDVAVLRLAEQLPVPVTTLPASAFAGEAQLKAAGVHICSPLFVLTYPQRFEANNAGFPVARLGIFASPPLLPVQTHPTFLADFTTFAGDSGGPVFIDGTDGHPLIVGVVLAQSHHEDRMKSEYEERIIRHPLGMGTILHAKHVHDTLKKAAAKNKRKTD
jgi:hypothetical protein